MLHHFAISYVSGRCARFSSFRLFPEDSEKKKLRDAFDQPQSAYTALEGQNRLLSDKLGDQESFVEQLNSALLQKDAEVKAKTRGSQRASVAASSRRVTWGNPQRELLGGGSVFHTKSATNSALAMAAAPLFDTITSRTLMAWYGGCFSQLTGLHLDAEEWEQASLSLAQGGLGLRSAAADAPAAYLASVGAMWSSRHLRAVVPGGLAVTGPQRQDTLEEAACKRPLVRVSLRPRRPRACDSSKLLEHGNLRRPMLHHMSGAVAGRSEVAGLRAELLQELCVAARFRARAVLRRLAEPLDRAGPKVRAAAAALLAAC